MPEQESPSSIRLWVTTKKWAKKSSFHLSYLANVGIMKVCGAGDIEIEEAIKENARGIDKDDN